MCWTLDTKDVHAARAARKAATLVLRSFTSCEATLGAAELIIGELLSNAARHADGKVCLELGSQRGHAEISVHDTSAMFALDICRPLDEYSESGRGLFIISELAKRVDVSPVSGIGKRVSVLLDLPLEPDTVIDRPCWKSYLRHEAGICMAPRISRYHPELVGRASR